MATDSTATGLDSLTRDSALSDRMTGTGASELLTWLRPLASLKLTVVLFLASIVLIMVGTLAQADKNMWEVLALYFRFPSAATQVILP